MEKRVIKIKQTVELPSTIYNNIHGVELVEQHTLCNNCFDIHQHFKLSFPYMDLVIFLSQEDYASFKKSEIDNYTVNNFFDLYQKGYCLYHENFRYLLMDHENCKGKAIVERIFEDTILEINYNYDKFKIIKDILEYNEEKFEDDVNSGKFEANAIDLNEE